MQKESASFLGMGQRWEKGMAIIREKSCGAVIFRKKKDIEVLVIRQNEGHWCFPKGHVEGEESEQETAQKETIGERTENRLKAIYRFDAESGALKPDCLFSIGVSRG